MQYIQPYIPNPPKPSRNRQGPPIHAPQYCVLYAKDGVERKSAWMSRERAHKALQIMRAKYGERNAICYMD